MKSQDYVYFTDQPLPKRWVCVLRVRVCGFPGWVCWFELWVIQLCSRVRRSSSPALHWSSEDSRSPSSICGSRRSNFGRRLLISWFSQAGLCFHVRPEMYSKEKDNRKSSNGWLRHLHIFHMNIFVRTAEFRKNQLSDTRFGGNSESSEVLMSTAEFVYDQIASLL